MHYPLHHQQQQQHHYTECLTGLHRPLCVLPMREMAPMPPPQQPLPRVQPPTHHLVQWLPFHSNENPTDSYRRHSHGRGTMFAHIVIDHKLRDGDAIRRQVAEQIGQRVARKVLSPEFFVDEWRREPGHRFKPHGRMQRIQRFDILVISVCF
jgi:hypothetical protein